MFILLLCLVQIGQLDDSGLGELGLSVVKRFPPSLSREAYSSLAGTLSEDGKLLFVGLGAKTPIYDLEIGENWYTEHIVYRKHRTGSWQFGTQSQWGHIPKEGWVGSDHTRVVLAMNRNDWISRVTVSDRQFIVAFIDQSERGVAPNRHVVVDGIKHNPGFSHLKAWFDGETGYNFGFLIKGQKEYAIRTYHVTPEDGTVKLTKAPLAASPILPRVKGEEIGPYKYDPVSKRMLYRGTKANGFVPSEWDSKSKTWRLVKLPNRVSKTMIMYWYGRLLISNRDTNELFLASDDRKSLKLIGKFIWLANSVSGEFCFVKEVKTGDYLLLKLASFRSSQS